MASKPQGFSSLSFQNQVRHNRFWHLFALSIQITFLPPIFVRSRPMRREGKMEEDKRRIENASGEHVSTYFWKPTPQMKGWPLTLLRRQRSVRVGRPSPPNECAHPQKAHSTVGHPLTRGLLPTGQWRKRHWKVQGQLKQGQNLACFRAALLVGLQAQPISIQRSTNTRRGNFNTQHQSNRREGVPSLE